MNVKCIKIYLHHHSQTNKKQITMRTTFKAVLFSPDGESVTDFLNRQTRTEVLDEINNMGSRWIFYPLAFVCTEGGTVKDTPEGLEFLKNKRLKTVKKFFSDTWEQNADEICEIINNGFPLHLIY